MATAIDLSLLNELFEEVVQEAEATGATADADTFAAFVAEHLPPDYLDLLVDDMNASLEEIWEDRYFEESEPEEEEVIRECEICDRTMPLTKHHLIPRETHKKMLKKGRFTKEEMTTRLAMICRMCHNAVHRFWDNDELAERYNTVELLMEDERMQKFARWASSQVVRSRRIIVHR